MNSEGKLALTGLSKAALEARLEAAGEPGYRAAQILDWIYAKRVTSFEQMTNLSQGLRRILEDSFTLCCLEEAGVRGLEDVTRKYLFRLGDGRFVETVLIPASPALYGESSERRTLCVSSQVGCAYGCKFCASGLAGFARDLEVAEIVEQVILVERLSGERVNNLVFMGMGEPLANFERVLAAIGIINASWGLGIGARRMTISTSGLAPEIRLLADQPLQIRLAVSLHGVTDEVREAIMPVNRKYPLEELFAALRYFRTRKKQRITFEYILIEGVNDHHDDARGLVRSAQEVSAKVNLIPYNLVDGLDWKRPGRGRQDAFFAVLQEAGIPATLRREKGGDIDAACGQLRLQTEAAVTQRGAIS
ncbi:MAG: 23S rRNA (adenine(2503)-C(2))-methyltransferase RlmN [Verrucomicrobiales bacterium]